MSRQSWASVGEEFAAGIAGEQRVGDHFVPVTQLFDTVRERPFMALGGGDEIQQRVGDAAARGQHDAEPRMRILLEDASDALHAYRIGDAGAAELMYAPPFHLPGSLVALSRRRAAVPSGA